MTPETSDTTEVRVPASGLVVLVGVSGSGKSSFAREHFRPTEIVSSDACRAMVSDDENDQSATPDAFELLNHIVGTRLRRGLLTVVDATNVQSKARAAGTTPSSTPSCWRCPRASPGGATPGVLTATSGCRSCGASSETSAGR